MSRDALKTLFHPFASATVAAPGEGERILFLGAEAGFALPPEFLATLTAVQGFRPLYRQLQASRIEATPEIEERTMTARWSSAPSTRARTRPTSPKHSHG